MVSLPRVPGMFVRTSWSSDLTPVARRALRDLAEVDQAQVSAEKVDPSTDTPRIHPQTALALVRRGYAEPTDDRHVQITREGLIKIGKVVLSRSENWRRVALTYTRPSSD